LSGQGLSAFFDFPWLPVYLFICFLLHPLIGLTVLIGAVILVVVAALTEWSTGHLNQNASNLRGRRNNFVASSLRSAEAAKAMGMIETMSGMWQQHQSALRAESARASDLIGGFAASSRAIRMVLQSGVMAVGAYLVVIGEASAGSIIAGSILSAKALAPVELGITNWRSFSSARHGWTQLQAFLLSAQASQVETILPAPSRSLSVENITGGPPRGRVTISDVSLSLDAGDALGIIGPSGSGKSTLARMIVGIWQSMHGAVRFDGASIEQWRPQDIGKYIGYLPQTIELFPGTISQNIGRFEQNASSTSVVAAATAAGVHELIVTLPQGYDTRIGEGGEALSMGQMQRVALARALFGEPFVVVLDEPNSNLDRDGDLALSAAIASVRARNGIVIVIAHRPSALENVNKVMVMAFGRVQHFGHREDFLRPAGSNVRPINGGSAPKEIANAAD
jgi:ATP-binding cassette subfamily C protein PrsD